jgi:hypothetical protein
MVPALLAGICFFLFLYQKPILNQYDSSELQYESKMDETIAHGRQKMFRGFTKAMFPRAFSKAHSHESREEVFNAYIDKIGATGVLSVLEEKLSVYCHSEAHALGSAIFKRTNNLQLSMQVCRDRCVAGCLHGAVTQAVRRIIPETSENRLDIQLIGRNIRNICDVEYVAGRDLEGTCIHGVGHAVMAVLKYNINDALKYCALFNDKSKAYYCATGAFMEYDNAHGAGDLLMERPLHYPCDTYTEYPAACYRYKWALLASKFERFSDAPTQSEECLGLDQRRRLGCFHGIGYAHVFALLEDSERLNNVCAYGNLDEQRVCIEGAMELLSELNEKKALEVCETLTGKPQRFCEEAARNRLYNLEKSFELYTRQTS